VFRRTAAQTLTSGLAVAHLTPTTPDWTNTSFSRVRGISRSKKIAGFKIPNETALQANLAHLRPRESQNKKEKKRKITQKRITAI
jgi:hypothetical protein